MEQVDIVAQLVTVAPVVAALVYFIVYFQKQIKKKDDVIAELNKEIRDSGREFIDVMKDVKNTLERLTDKIDAL